ncbi:MAG: hypothetical protein K8T89_15640 [Planctomycetes bacterium]|nr:hypothetical protein [Planctomycetota bacterium]
MDEIPSFYRRADVRRLVIALLVPWLLGAFGVLIALLGHLLLNHCGVRSRSLYEMMFFTIHGLFLLSMMSALFWCVAAIWRLLWWTYYCFSWYGWLSPVLMFINFVLVVVVLSKIIG